MPDIEVKADVSIPSISMYQACLLHSRADRVLRSLVAGQLEALKVTMMEWLLLGVVGEGPDNGMSLSDIAKRLDVSQPQVTALMTKVSKQRLVRQKVQRHDRRSRHVVLSTRGQRMLDLIEDAIATRLKEWLADVPREQLKHYIQTIEFISTRQV
jgi:DNA-binding MarR family transcriptional regulator